MGGFLIAIAMEKHRLHVRVALKILSMAGKSGNGIIAGFIAATAFLSMWISNTATALMMLPIANSVILMIGEQTEDPVARRNFSVSLLLGIAYAANIGGIATPVGTPPNSVAIGFLDRFAGIKVDFATWTGFALPLSLLFLLTLYFILVRFIFPNRLHNLSNSAEWLETELSVLGDMTTAEKRVLGVFALTAFLWVFRSLINHATDLKLEDSMIAVAGGILLFLIPKENNSSERLLAASDFKNVPWGILLLFGGGLALADGLYTSGVAKLLGEIIGGNQEMPFTLILFAVAVLGVYATEIMSNVALTTVMLPVLASLSESLGRSPLIFSVVIAISSSCAFMLPMATPPNAIVFADGKVKVNDMMRAGFWLNLVSVALVSFFALKILPFFAEI
jgi:sodium-dependent dicarboxylate transporter 2/3/5